VGPIWYREEDLNHLTDRHSAVVWFMKVGIDVLIKCLEAISNILNTTFPTAHFELSRQDPKAAQTRY